MYARLAPIAQAPMMIPSSTSKGPRSMIMRSLNEPGSDSSPFTTITFMRSFVFGMKLHFSPVAKPAPPRPRRPDAFTISTTCSGVCASALRSPAKPPFAS